MRLFAFAILVRKHDSGVEYVRSIPVVVSANSDKEAYALARQEAAKKFPPIEGWTMKGSMTEIDQSKLLETLHGENGQVVSNLY